LASTEETKPNTTKANIYPQHNSTTTQIITTNQVWSIPTTWSGNRTGRNMQLPGPTCGCSYRVVTHVNSTITKSRRLLFTDTYIAFIIIVCTHSAVALFTLSLLVCSIFYVTSC